MKLCFDKVDSGIELGLHRIQRVMDEAGNPEKRFCSVLVGGTNGKGSTATILADLLVLSGKKVGLYRSPHMMDVTERVRVGERHIPRNRLLDLSKEVERLAALSGVKLTPFEHFTAVALLCFAQEGVEWVVAEVGMGGRLDATNILSASLSIITGVAADHRQWLGQSIKDIAREKGGIIKEGSPLIIGKMDTIAMNVILSMASNLDAAVHLYGREFVAKICNVTIEGVEFSYISDRSPSGLKGLMVPALGRHFAENAAVALRAFELICGDSLSEETAQEAIKRFLLPGRGDVVRLKKGIRVLDVAHNTHGMEQLCQGLKEVLGKEQPLVLFSLLKDKEWREMFNLLSSYFKKDRIGFVELPHEERVLAKQDAQSLCVASYTLPVFKEALLEHRGTVVICGCFAIVRAALSILRGEENSDHNRDD